MRKIERAMVAAIKAGKNRKDGNTEVVHFAYEGVPDGCHVYLHGHRIAERHNNTWRFSLAGWNTPTTRSRLSALVREFRPGTQGIRTCLGQAYYCTGQGDQPIDNGEWF